MEASGVEIAIRLLVVAGLILLNGFFVAAEFAIVGVRKTRIEAMVEERRAGSKAVAVGKNDPDSFVAAAQLGITMASLALGWVGEPALASLFEPLFAFLPPDVGFFTSHFVAVVLAFALITSLHMILGEQVPKVAALHDPEGIALFTAAPTLFFGTLFRPFIRLVNGLSNGTLRLMGMEPAAGHTLVHSVEELRMLVEQSSAAGFLEQEETEIAQRAFELGELSARDVMIPRTELSAVPITIDEDDLVAWIVADGHSRFPVYQGTVDNVIGVIHVKDVLRLVTQEGKQSVRSIMRQPLFVPETLPANELLALMRSRKRHIAVAVDEYGGTAGIVTLEDIVERLVGAVQDEFEQPELRIQKQEDGSYLVNGLVNLTEFAETVGIELESEDYSTIGGYVFGLLGRRPEVGDEVQSERFRAKVESLDGLRIALLRLVPDQPRTDDEETGEDAAG